MVGAGTADIGSLRVMGAAWRQRPAQSHSLLYRRLEQHNVAAEEEESKRHFGKHNAYENGRLPAGYLWPGPHQAQLLQER